MNSWLVTMTHIASLENITLTLAQLCFHLVELSCSFCSPWLSRTTPGTIHQRGRVELKQSQLGETVAKNRCEYNTHTHTPKGEGEGEGEIDVGKPFFASQKHNIFP